MAINIERLKLIRLQFDIFDFAVNSDMNDLETGMITEEEFYNNFDSNISYFTEQTKN